MFKVNNKNTRMIWLGNKQDDVNYFGKNFPSWPYDRTLNTPRESFDLKIVT